LALRLALGTAVVAAGAAALWALAAGPAGARPGRIQLKLVQGKLSIAAPTRISAGARSTSVTVTDARGTGAGWSLRLATPRSLKVTRITASCAAGSTCTLPQAKGIGSGSVVLRAARHSGMGVIRLTVTFGQLHAAAPVRFSIASG
jgi:hypothetical protein